MEAEHHYNSCTTSKETKGEEKGAEVLGLQLCKIIYMWATVIMKIYIIFFY